jgi:sulfonate transport system substrate-binding protein
MNSVQIRLGGVPEHFNLPIDQAIKEGKFEKAGINLNWINYPGGTGEMSQALRDDNCDICILLTEGIIRDIIQGNPSKIISGYVKSPLIWGVHTGTKNSLNSHDLIFDQKIAISRTGSGSHLMPTVDALMKGEKVHENQFVTVKNIDGAIQSLNNGETDVFYWEKYTTKPYVAKGFLKRIGEFISPWPCFMIAATNNIIASQPDIIDKILKIIHQSCDEFMQNPRAADLVSEKYGITIHDANYWFHTTEWATDSWVSDKMLMSVLFTLKEAGVVDKNAKGDNLVWQRK